MFVGIDATLVNDKLVLGLAASSTESGGTPFYKKCQQ